MQKPNSTLRTVRMESKHRPRPRADRPASGVDRSVGEEPKKPKVTGSVKWIIASSRTIRGARTDRPWLPFIWHLTTHLMHYRRWYSRYCWPLRFQPLMYRGGPSGPGARTIRGRRIGATARKWLVAINTTPTTSIQDIQAFTTHSMQEQYTTLQDTNQSLWSNQIPQFNSSF
jgi:hypothetical protein